MRIAIPALSPRRYHAAWQRRLAKDRPPAQAPDDPDRLRQLFAQDLKASIAKPHRVPNMTQRLK